MRFGTIRCTCGQEFYFETVRTTIKCIRCAEEYDVNEYPKMKDNKIDLNEEGSSDEIWS